MKEYLKMADVFSGKVKEGLTVNGPSIHGDSHAFYANTKDRRIAVYASHAINSHDELVAEVERLRSMIEAITDCEIDDAPHGYSHEESSAWSSGYNHLAMKIRDAL